MRTYGKAILPGRFEKTSPSVHDIGVGEVLLVEGNKAPFGAELGLKVLIGRGQGNASVADLNDEVGDLETVADGGGGSSHVAWEPVDGSASADELHLCQPHPLLHQFL